MKQTAREIDRKARMTFAAVIVNGDRTFAVQPSAARARGRTKLRVERTVIYTALDFVAQQTRPLAAV